MTMRLVPMKLVASGPRLANARFGFLKVEERGMRLLQWQAAWIWKRHTDKRREFVHNSGNVVEIHRTTKTLI